MYFKLFAVLLLSACATGSLPQPVRAGDPNVKTVTQVIEFISPPQWRSSGYSRLEDAEAPVKLILAGDATACAVWNFELTPIRPGEYYQCKTKWRSKRQ